MTLPKKLEIKNLYSPHVVSQTKHSCMINHRQRSGVVVITISQLHSSKPELRFRAGSNSARGVLEIRDGEDL